VNRDHRSLWPHTPSIWKAAEAGQLGVAAVSYLPGSVGRVIDDYKVCNIKNKHFIGFLRLKYSSQLNYRRALDIIKRKGGYYQMIDVTQEGIRGFRNEDQGKLRHIAN
jgi:hypothetical protein